MRLAIPVRPDLSSEIREDTVCTLLARGQAASLQHRLGEASRARVEQALRERPEREIIIRANSRTADPRWPEVQEQERMLQRSLTGIVTGEALAPRDSALICFVIHWDEWPVLKRLQDRFHVAVQGRREAAARWVTDEFQRRGMGTFRD